MSLSDYSPDGGGETINPNFWKVKEGCFTGVPSTEVPLSPGKVP